MKQLQMIWKCAAVIFILMAFSQVFAEEAAEESASNFNIGPGIFYRSSPYKGDDDLVLPIPIIFYDSKTFFFKGRDGGCHLFEQEGFSFDLVVQLRAYGYEADDSRYLEGMSDRRMSIDGGVSASYFDGWGTTSVSFVNDLLGNHDGQEVSIRYSKRIIITEGKLSFTPSVGVLYQSNNLTDYYYGVRSNEAIAGRPQYSAGDAWNPFVGLQMQYKINSNWSATAAIQCDFLDDEITDSPIVDEDFQVVLVAGAMYKF